MNHAVYLNVIHCIVQFSQTPWFSNIFKLITFRYTMFANVHLLAHLKAKKNKNLKLWSYIALIVWIIIGSSQLVPVLNKIKYFQWEYFCCHNADYLRHIFENEPGTSPQVDYKSCGICQSTQGINFYIWLTFYLNIIVIFEFWFWPHMKNMNVTCHIPKILESLKIWKSYDSSIVHTFVFGAKAISHNFERSFIWEQHVK